VTAGLRAPPATDPPCCFAQQQSWSLPFALQRTSAFGDAAATTTGFTGRVVSPQVGRPADCRLPVTACLSLMLNAAC
jgi:hypothetical protein